METGWWTLEKRDNLILLLSGMLVPYNGTVTSLYRQMHRYDTRDFRFLYPLHTPTFPFQHALGLYRGIPDRHARKECQVLQDQATHTCNPDPLKEIDEHKTEVREWYQIEKLIEG